MEACEAACRSSCSYQVNSFWSPLRKPLWVNMGHRQKPAHGKGSSVVLPIQILASELTQKATEQADAMQRVKDVCRQSVSFKGLRGFYQVVDGPLRCTYTHVQGHGRPDRSFIINVAALHKQAKKQVEEIEATLKAGSAAHAASGYLGWYHPPSKAQDCDFHQEVNGDLFVNFCVTLPPSTWPQHSDAAPETASSASKAGHANEKMMITMAARTLIAWGEHHFSNAVESPVEAYCPQRS